MYELETLGNRREHLRQQLDFQNFRLYNILGPVRGFNIVQNSDGSYKAGVLQKSEAFVTDDSDLRGIFDRGMKAESLKPGEKQVGTLHTHPYTNGIKNIAHSDADVLESFKGNAGTEGYTVMVESGDKRFALVILDPEKAKKFLSKGNYKDNLKKYNDNYTGSAQAQEFNATLAVVGDGSESGIGFFSTTDPSKVNFVQVMPPKPGGTKEEKKQ